ncbi:NUDIX hydrolase [Dictyobacter aurantiacus]|nr:CoA pyrophosphatase [Dictyobacter aurantiacus]
MDVLDFTNTAEIMGMLRTRLTPVEQAGSLIDRVEGHQQHARLAAVLLPFFVEDGLLQLALIRRASTLRAHSGEIAFPGGKVDATDTSMVITALREAYEEIGLHPARVEALGVLPPVFTVVSNYLITPVVGYLPQGLGSLLLQKSEVDELLCVSLARLADPAIAHTELWTRDGRTRTVYFYDYDQYRIWGATGRILSSLFELLKQEDAPPVG